jgi:hypothetical protein
MDLNELSAVWRCLDEVARTEAQLAGLDLMPGKPVEICLTAQEQTAMAFFARPLMGRYERAQRED